MIAEEIESYGFMESFKKNEHQTWKCSFYNNGWLLSLNFLKFALGFFFLPIRWTKVISVFFFDK